MEKTYKFQHRGKNFTLDLVGKEVFDDEDETMDFYSAEGVCTCGSESFLVPETTHSLHDGRFKDLQHYMDCVKVLVTKGIRDVDRQKKMDQEGIDLIKRMGY